MSSFWLCCDPDPPQNLSNNIIEAKVSAGRNPSPFFGIFKEDPAAIGRMLPRPSTPFNSESSNFSNGSQLDKSFVDFSSAYSKDLSLDFQMNPIPIF